MDRAIIQYGNFPKTGKIIIRSEVISPFLMLYRKGTMPNTLIGGGFEEESTVNPCHLCSSPLVSNEFDWWTDELCTRSKRGSNRCIQWAPVSSYRRTMRRHCGGNSLDTVRQDWIFYKVIQGTLLLDSSPLLRKQCSITLTFPPAWTEKYASYQVTHLLDWEILNRGDDKIVLRNILCNIVK